MGLADGLLLFCEYLVKQHGDPGKISEDLKAEEFKRYFLRDLPANVRSLRLVASVCGINTEAIDSGKMPNKMRGCHETIGSLRNIYYREEDSQSGIQNTLLHEFREMLDPRLADVFPKYRLLSPQAAHRAANLFASAVLLPSSDFIRDIYQTGFDVAALSKIYSKSSSQVLLRMGEVLKGKLFFYGALYEKEIQESDRWQLTYRSLTNNGYQISISGLFPRKESKAKTGSLIETCAQTSKPHIVEYVIKRGGAEINLVSLAQPLLIDRSVNKVAMVTLLHQDIDCLKPQVDHASPVKLKTIRLNI